MFDLTSSKLLILGVVALIVVGPKELPFLLRTIGKYVGMIRRHANEFRAQFDEAMREAELDGIKKDLEAVARDTENTIRSAQTSFEHDIHKSTAELDASLNQPVPPPAEPVHADDPPNAVEAQLAAPAPSVETAQEPVISDVPIPVPAPEAPVMATAEQSAAHARTGELAKTGT